MATIAFSLAGQFVGGLVGGPIGATIGRALGALAGSAVDGAIFGDKSEQVGNDVRLQGSMQGTAITRIYGWNRVSGNIIWGTELEKISTQSAGAKGFGKSEEEQIVANFAVALCEGEVARLGRIWADGELLETEGLNIRFYSGSETQLPDSLISAKQGVEKTPAYRGLCYLVFERLPLEQFGNRIPNISVELCRATGDLENSIKAITIIPGATEFGYDPEPRVRIVSPGNVVSENAHFQGKISNWTMSVDELVALCPNLENVAIVVSWFGDDLRCGNCKIQPRVEGASREIKDTDWVVNGLSRNQVPLVSQSGGGAAYGGTPSDNALLAAIADLKARGLKVTLYPLIMMDIDANNSLLDPYTQNLGQSAYPWRGRITCDPAQGVAGTPDKTLEIDVQVNSFIGNAQVGDFIAGTDTINYHGAAADWGYRRMVLHYAKLAQLAGGIDAFLIGSEMRQMTFLRRAQSEFPFVDALVDLATDVRSIVGANTKITYAADWSEYSGYQPSDAPGDKYFHLDKLWANANIDAIGIDNYMPLSDWRDGDNHPDALIASSSHDLDYLQGNIFGGEGYDFYYGSSQDRIDKNRSLIVDGAYGEDWVWRYKDLRNWWSEAHHNRIGGVRQAGATPWVAQSKPFWLTEVGCGAVDKGSNAPNAFADSKSSEDTLPHFSNGKSDVLQQRQHLRAHHLFWQSNSPKFEEANNPVSSVYGGRMLDGDRIYVWTWDARPFPAFPNMLSVWSDGINYATGHWLTGRLGSLSVGEFVEAVANDYDVKITVQNSLNIQADGLQINAVTNLRNGVSSLLDVGGLNIIDSVDGLIATKNTNKIDVSILKNDCVVIDKDIITRVQPDFFDGVGFLGLSYSERKNSYLNATISSNSLKGEGVAQVNSGLVMAKANARSVAQSAIDRINVNSDVIEFALPLSKMNLEVGDVIDVESQLNGPFIINEIRDGSYRKISARAVGSQNILANDDDENLIEFVGTPIVSAPEIIIAHLPPLASAGGASRLFIGAYAKPWSGYVLLEDEATGLEIARVNQSATIGETVSAISAGNSHLWDYGNELEVKLYGGHLSSALEASVLASNNRLAVQRDDASWEIIAFVEAELIGDVTYRLSKLLRNLNGTDGEGSISVGNKIMLIDQSVAIIDVGVDMLGLNVSATAYAGSNDALGQEVLVNITNDPELPLAPVHLISTRDYASDDISFSWVRRTRVNGDSWALNEVPLVLLPESYLVRIFNGGALVRTITSSVMNISYSSADQVADFGILPSSFDFEVAQISPVFGAGHVTSAQFTS